MLKLGVEVVLMLVFLATAVLRSALAKQDLVDAKLLSPESLTMEEKRMPEATPCPPPCTRFCCRTNGLFADAPCV